ncbi:MAG: carbohydrate deacetylase [Deltaproteobacteria bacterium]
MSAACRLIVNADDFGQSPGVNRGVLQGHDEGIVASASLMVRWPAAADAALAVRSRPRLSLGLHVDLGEWRFEEGQWVPVYGVVSLDDADAIRSEIHQQLETFRRFVGYDPTHIDSHQHVHRREPARSVFATLARELGVPLRHFARNVRYCGDFYGQDERGATAAKVLSTEHLITILESLPPGVTELACHPASVADLPTMYSHERLMELAVLCDERVKQTIASLGIELCSFHDVSGEPVERSRVGGIP